MGARSRGDNVKITLCPRKVGTVLFVISLIGVCYESEENDCFNVKINFMSLWICIACFYLYFGARRKNVFFELLIYSYT